VSSYIRVDEDTLSPAVEFDHPFRVLGRGIITNRTEFYAPEMILDEEIQGSGWEFVNGYSGQDRYSGPIMHNSEYLGGGMARDVLASPGVYVLMVAHWTPEDGEREDDPDGPYDWEGWALLKREEDAKLFGMP